VSRRALLIGSGSAFTIPTPTTFTLTTADDAGWTHANAPKAVEHGGYLFFTYVDMASGNLEVRSMLLSSPYTVSSATVIEAAYEADMHAAASLWVRSDDRLLIVYSKHDGATLSRKVSTNALPDISAFGSSASIATAGDYTYPTIVSYLGNPSVWYRRFSGGTTSTYGFNESLDDGDTWSGWSPIYVSSGRSSYLMIDSTGSRWDIAASDGRNPPDSDPVTIGHAYYDGTWRKSDGTAIGSAPFGPADMTEVYDSADGMGWPQDIVAGTSPVFTYAVLNDPASNSWRRAHWTGSAWVNRTIDESDGDIDSGFASCVVLDHTDPDRAYAPVLVGSNWVMNRYFTADAGATWSTTTIASGATDHLIPGPVYGSTGTVKVLWMSGGPYTGYLDGGFGLMAGR
jgi:hypothetical protein